MDEAGVFESVGVERQLDALSARALDPRPSLTTPFPSLNALLHRGGVHPGELVVLGGRKGTRKTCVTLSWAVHLLRQDVPVGILTLDESLAMYVSKLMSALFRVPSEYIEAEWESPDVRGLREQYESLASKLTLSEGVRPNIAALSVQELCSATIHRYSFTTEDVRTSVYPGSSRSCRCGHVSMTLSWSLCTRLEELTKVWPRSITVTRL